MDNINKLSVTYLKAVKKLSVRECEILDKVSEGKTNRQIAAELFLSKRTVENHRTKICRKIGVRGRGALEKWISTYYNKKIRISFTQNNE